MYAYNLFEEIINTGMLMTRLMKFVFVSNKICNTEDLTEEFLKYLSSFGLDKFIMAELLPPANETRSSRFRLMANYPDEWVKHYAEQGFENYDPVYQKGLVPGSLFTWHEAEREFRNAGAARVMKEAREYGLCSGVGLSFLYSPHMLVGFGMASADDSLDFNRDELSALRLAAIHCFDVFAKIALLDRGDTDPASLTVREREVLLWIAAGKSRKEISTILGISQSCVKRHCEHLFDKLGVNSAAYAVSKAIQLKLIPS